MKKKTREKLIEILIFLLKFNLLAIPLYLLIFLNFSYPPLQEFVATIAFHLLKFMNVEASLKSSTILAVKGLNVAFIDVSMDCTGWKSLYALFALTISTPKIKIKKKLVFLLFSLPCIFFFNIFRIAFTTYVYLMNPQSFEFVHNFFWQWGLILTILFSWVIFLKIEKMI